MLSIEGSPSGDDWNSGEFGTNSGVQVPVNVSSVSPLGHAATDGPAVAGTVKAATAGTAAIATANPPARISRRTENSRVAIVTLSVVLTDSTRNGLIASRIPPQEYAQRSGNIDRSRVEMVRPSRFCEPPARPLWRC